MTEPKSATGLTAAGTRDRLIRAGVAQFQANGYHGTGVAAILADTGLPKGSFYHHFPGGKEELAVAAVGWLRAQVAGYLSGQLEANAPADDIVVGMARYAARGLQGKTGTRGSLVAVLAADAVPGSTQVAQALRYTVEAWSGLLEVAARRQGVDDPAAWARSALAQLEGATMLARISGRPADVVDALTSWTRRVGAAPEHRSASPGA